MTLTEVFLYRVSNVLDALSSGSRARSSLVLAAGVAVTVAASFGRSVAGLALVALAAAALAAASGKLREWVLVTAVALLFSTVVSAPRVLGLLPPGRGAGVELFVARATASASFFTAILGYAGWRGLLSGLRPLGDLGVELSFTTRFVPVFSWKALRMLAAREARILSGSRGALWRVAISTAGDLLAAGFRKAYWVRLAFAARDFGRPPRRVRARLGAADIVIASLAPLLVAVCLV